MPATAPTHDDHGHLLPTLALATVFGVHVAAGPHLFDAGELAAAAWELGGSHPPGQPLHALLTHALARLLVVGPLAGRMALVSALFAVVAAEFAGRMAALLCRGRTTASLARLAHVAACVGVALCPIVLRQSLRIEVYTLALALSIGAQLALVRWVLFKRLSDFFSATVLAGLAAAAHPPHALACAALGAVLAVGIRRDIWRRPTTLALGGLLALCVALLVYAYLPLRAVGGASMWGTPETMPGFVSYLRGDIFARNLGTGGGAFTRQLWAFVRHLSLATGVVPWVGTLLLMRAHPRLGTTLACGVVAQCAAAALQPLDAVNPDNVAYLGPAVALLMATGSAGLAVGFGGLPAAPPRWLAPLVTRLVLVLLALPPGNLAALPGQLQADLPAFETWTGMLTDDPPPRALVVLNQDAAAAGLMMAKQLDGARPDLALFVPGLATNRFHWRSLRAHPLFDGRPVLGPGVGRRAQLEAGAAARVRGQVAVYAERASRTGGPLRTNVSGGYLVEPAAPAKLAKLADAAGDEGHTSDAPQASIGERLAGALAADQGALDAAASGDMGLAAGILRDHQLTRARRLLTRGATRAALQALVHSVPEMPRDQQQDLLQGSESPFGPFPGYVDRPDVPFATRGDAERAVSAYAFSRGDLDLAERILVAQAARGDTRAYLQMAVLQHANGRPDRARQLLARFLALAPDLAPEARALLPGLQVRP